MLLAFNPDVTAVKFHNVRIKDGGYWMGSFKAASDLVRSTLLQA